MANNINKIKKSEIHSIFQRLIKNDNNALEELYTKYNKIVINIAFSILKNREIADEISQAVFVKLLQLPKEKLPTKSELNWLYTVTKNQAIEYLRKQKDTLNIDDYEIEKENNELDGIIDIDTYNDLMKCLTISEREIVSLKVLSNFTFKEIGQILNIPIGTVQWKYYKAIHTLKLSISNLLLFVISFSIYVTYKSKVIKSNEKSNTTGNAHHNSTSIVDSINPSEIIGSTDSITSTSSISSITNGIEIGLISITSIFLILAIFFGIIFAKHQQKRKQKTSK